ncbi:sensor histidine kinase [Streptomyces sp. NBC_01198]|uniref:sensor histidine kinase n=1 Tax=Streptomyces sp. NBC_01198 TaxID=2903769 RepID=UPI002E0F3647|nr:sensor histidine kinase [Streptomyces sp. NBC_01198]
MNSGRAREAAASPHAPAVTAALLAAAAVAEAALRAALTGGYGRSFTTGLLAVAVLALATTVPPAFLSAPAAALAVSSGAVLSLVAFRTLTAAGALALLLSLRHLTAAAPADGAPRGEDHDRPRRRGLRQPAASGAHPEGPDAGRPTRGVRRTSTLQGLVLAVPFTAVALLDPHLAGEARALAVLLASTAPAAVLAGAAGAARAEARVHSAARELTARSVREHTARGERARIARELHDVVAHHISMIAVQAETARLTTPGMPAAGAARLSEIGDTARAGLTEMRRLLDVLRQDAEVRTPERRPQPGLQQLNELLDEARCASGAGVRLIVSGPAAALDPGVELAAFRIVQEALTNVRRHAGGAAVDVELHYAADALWLRVRDNGPGPVPAARTGGHGLPGMRERAAAVGGTLRTGRAAGGGFLIEASLPAGAEVVAR